MASKFQNRLVGTIALVALSVIVLPVIFDGDKKYNESQFAAIPLMPTAGDEEEVDSIPSLIQNMPSTPTEGAGEAVKELETQGPDDYVLSESLFSELEPTVEPSATEAPKTAVKAELPSQQKVETQPLPKAEPPTKAASQAEAKSTSTAQAPQASAYVVQLGALKNADKVEEIVARLRLSGHQVYTVPASPVQGQLTRIYVGPNASKQALTATLSELKEMTGLHGQIKNYQP
ncbi:Protein dedD [Xenorhabdus poinarii G6]|uniref:Protein dedD n=1 Tax=Xenorhabdus poinarii G6 TaxID=1354304 RepID=A0A068R0P7_9GAMM|nr:cell division protein DedD [Xenorhabdus poinarii]CDG20862.1 Protein dedD [Xenorhabdus poinarii G6]